MKPNISSSEYPYFFESWLQNEAFDKSTAASTHLAQKCAVEEGPYSKLLEAMSSICYKFDDICVRLDPQFPHQINRWGNGILDVSKQSHFTEMDLHNHAFGYLDGLDSQNGLKLHSCTNERRITDEDQQAVTEKLHCLQSHALKTKSSSTDYSNSEKNFGTSTLVTDMCNTKQQDTQLPANSFIPKENVLPWTSNLSDPSNCLPCPSMNSLQQKSYIGRQNLDSDRLEYPANTTLIQRSSLQSCTHAVPSHFDYSCGIDDFLYLLEISDTFLPTETQQAREAACKIAGVYWDKRSWIASWYQDGKRHYKSYSARTHGFYKSKFWAINTRFAKIKEQGVHVKTKARSLRL